MEIVIAFFGLFPGLAFIGEGCPCYLWVVMWTISLLSLGCSLRLCSWVESALVFPGAAFWACIHGWKVLVFFGLAFISGKCPCFRWDVPWACIHGWRGWGCPFGLYS